MDPREMQRRSTEAKRRRQTTANGMKVGDRPSLPASPPASPSDWWEREQQRMRDELDRLASENDPARRWYVLRLRGQLLKLMGLKAMGVKPSDPAPTAKPKRADIGDLIAQAEADSAGDTPEDAQ